MERNAERRGGDEHERKRKAEPARADGNADRDEEGQVIGSDHRMAEAGQEAFAEC